MYDLEKIKIKFYMFVSSLLVSHKYYRKCELINIYIIYMKDFNIDFDIDSM